MMRSYWPAIIVSVFAHGLLIAAATWGWQLAPKEDLIKTPSYIKATLLAPEQAAKPTVTKPVPKPVEVQPTAPKKVDLTQQRQEQERLKKLAAEKQQKDKLLKEKAEQAQAEKIKKDKAQKLAAEKQKQAAEKAKKEAEAQKQKEEALREQAALEREQQLQEQREAKERQNLRNNLAKEKAQLNAEIAEERQLRQAQEDEVSTQSYSALIQSRVTDAWSRPPSARNEMLVELTIQLIPTGEVIDVTISDSSGNAAFDRSAVRAVNKVRQFPEIKDMPSRLFEQEFRSFKLKFTPQDLRQ